MNLLMLAGPLFMPLVYDRVLASLGLAYELLQIAIADGLGPSIDDEFMN